jgi:hypothetical protein
MGIGIWYMGKNLNTRYENPYTIIYEKNNLASYPFLSKIYIV